MDIHEDITFERIEEAVRLSMFDLSSPGFCNACGDDADGVEPDAQNYKCETCGAMQVFGAEEFLFELDGR